jgi:hypothetical protein
MIMTYAWQAASTAQEIRMMRFRKRIRDRFRRGHEHTVG